MRGRQVWLGLAAWALASFAGGAGATDAAEEPESEGPSVCVPPCEGDDACVGGKCVDPRTHRSTRPTGKPTTQRPTTPPTQHAPGHPPPPKQPAPAPAPRPPAATQAQPPAPPPTTYPPPAGYPPPSPPPAYYPPPGYYYPPPGYYPPPRYYYPPPVAFAPPPRTPRKKRGFFALPYLGLHSYRQANASSYGPGVRVGTVMGGRVSDLISLNGELSFDMTNANVPSTVGYSEYAVDFAFSPLAQIPAGPVEIVIGPKLGIFILRTEVTQAGLRTEAEADGWIAGANGGLFVPVSPTTSLGLLMSFELKWMQAACVRNTSASDFCQAVSGSNAQVLGVSLGATF